MDSFSTSEFPAHYLWIALAIAAGVAVVFTLVQALVMRFANRVCGGEPIGFFYSAFVVWMTSLAGGIVSGGVTASLSDGSGLMASVLGLVASVITLCVLLKLDPLRAFGVYIVQAVMGVVIMLFLGLFMVLGGTAMIPAEVLSDLQASAAVWDATSGESGEDAPWSQLSGSSSELALPANTGDMSGGFEWNGDQNNPFFQGPSSEALLGGKVDELREAVGEVTRQLETSPASAASQSTSATAASDRSGSGPPKTAAQPDDSPLHGQASSKDIAPVPATTAPPRALPPTQKAKSLAAPAGPELKLPFGGSIRSNPFVK